MKFRRQKSVYEAVLRHSRQAIEGCGGDLDTKMRLAALAPAAVSGVLVRFVQHFERRGRKAGGQLGRDSVVHCHGLAPALERSSRLWRKNIIRSDALPRSAGAPSLRSQ